MLLVQDDGICRFISARTGLMLLKLAYCFKEDANFDFRFESVQMLTVCVKMCNNADIENKNSCWVNETIFGQNLIYECIILIPQNEHVLNAIASHIWGLQFKF